MKVTKQPDTLDGEELLLLTDSSPLRMALETRRELLLRIDEAIDQLGEFVRAEMALRSVDVRPFLNKEHREPLGDMVFLSCIKARLGEHFLSSDTRMDRSKHHPRVASLADFHPVVIEAVRTGERTIPIISRNQPPISFVS